MTKTDFEDQKRIIKYDYEIPYKSHYIAYAYSDKFSEWGNKFINGESIEFGSTHLICEAVSFFLSSENCWVLL